MVALFWICWLIDLAICALALIAKSFADSFHERNATPWLLLILIICTVGGLVLQVFFRKTNWALFVAAVPLAAFLVLYLVEKATGQ